MPLTRLPFLSQRQQRFQDSLGRCFSLRPHVHRPGEEEDLSEINNAVLVVFITKPVHLWPSQVIHWWLQLFGQPHSTRHKEHGAKAPRELECVDEVSRPGPCLPTNNGEKAGLTK